MVTCARQAPACIELVPMAPINTTFALAPTSTTITATTSAITLKPKLAFSIDALVGDSCNNNNNNKHLDNNETECDVIAIDSPIATSERCRSCSPPHKKAATLVRPMPLQSTNALPQNATNTHLLHLTATATIPNNIVSTVPTSNVPTAPPAHFLTAQFQMAAALAHQHHQQQQQQQQHMPSIHLASGHPLSLFPHMAPTHAPMLANPQFIRDTYPLYPWFLSRHGRIFPHRFPGSK